VNGEEEISAKMAAIKSAGDTVLYIRSLTSTLGSISWRLGEGFQINGASVSTYVRCDITMNANPSRHTLLMLHFRYEQYSEYRLVKL